MELPRIGVALCAAVAVKAMTTLRDADLAAFGYAASFTVLVALTTYWAIRERRRK